MGVTVTIVVLLPLSVTVTVWELVVHRPLLRYIRLGVRATLYLDKATKGILTIPTTVSKGVEAVSKRDKTISKGLTAMSKSTTAMNTTSTAQAEATQ